MEKKTRTGKIFGYMFSYILFTAMFILALTYTDTISIIGYCRALIMTLMFVVLGILLMRYLNGKFF